MPLEELAPGEQGEITEIRHCGGCGGGCHGHEKNHSHHGQKSTTTRAEKMGLLTGKMVEVLKNDGQQLLLLVDDIRIVIDRNIARNVHVKECTA